MSSSRDRGRKPSSRRRRGQTATRRWRRFLLEHRFNAAEGLLGVAALGAALWLLWPSGNNGAVDHRNLWQESLANATAAEDDAAVAAVDLAAGSASISAKRHLVGGFGAPSGPSLRPRLAKVADTMPAIGPPQEALVLDDTGQASRAGRAAVPHQGFPALTPAALRVPDPDGIPTWLRNAAVQPVVHDRPMIAVVMDDLGLNRRNTAALNTLDGPLTLAFLPYAGALAEQAQAGRKAGHELLLHMPMEPVGSDWPGPDALVSSIDQGEFERRLEKNLRSFSGFVGISNHMGSRLTTKLDRMGLVMAELRARGLLFLDSKTTGGSVGAATAARYGVPFATRDVFIDNELDLGHVLSQLRAVERLAKQNGAAVAIGHPHDVTIEALRRWLPTLAERGFALVPISTVVARQTCPERPILVAGCSIDADDGLIGPVTAGVESRRG